MANEVNFYHVRMLSQKPLVADVDRIAATGRQTSGGSWIQDMTGRVTDKSKDDKNDTVIEGDDRGEGLYLHAAHDNVPRRFQPIFEFAQTEPYYPIVYSCVHILLSPQEDEEHSRVDRRYDFVAPPPETDQLLNVTSVPISLQMLLPKMIKGQELAVDDVIANVNAMQWSLLTLVAAATGLSKNCNIEKQYNDRPLYNNHGMLRRLQSKRPLAIRTAARHIEALPYPTSIFEVASDRERTKWIGLCTVEYNRSESNCFTMQTEMKITYSGLVEESNIINEYIQSILHNQIAVDAKQVFAMNVVGLYLADESEADISTSTPTNTFSPPFDTPVSEHEGSTRHPIGGFATNLFSPQILFPLVAGLFVLLAWLIFHLYSRNQRKQQFKATRVQQSIKEGSRDIESGSVHTAPTISPANSGTDYVNEFTTPERKVGLIIHQSFNNEKPSRGRPLFRRSHPVSVDSPDRKPLPVSVDSPDRSAAGLPPRPPRQSSVKLKKNRKKKRKKGKKVITLKRVNSREGINELPMISESDEDSEMGSQCGDSEYTSDDGTSSIEASSGCLTPARSSSLSRKSSSRASSPQLSPRDELFGVDSLDHDVEFVIEAPDFPNFFTEKKVAQKRMRFQVKELKKLEIEPARSRSKSKPNEDCTSPKRRLPLPWLND